MAVRSPYTRSGEKTRCEQIQWPRLFPTATSVCGSRLRGCRRENRGCFARRAAAELILPLRRLSRSAAGSPQAVALSDSVRPTPIVGATSEARVWVRDSRVMTTTRVAEPADAAAIFRDPRRGV